MACDVPGSWANYAAGLGVGVPVDGTTLDGLVAFYRQRNREPRIQLTPYQHSSLWDGLAARGFVPYDRDTVLVHPLRDLPALPSGPLGFRLIDRRNPDDVVAFRDSQMTGFFDGKEVPAGMLPITERVARSPRVCLWLLTLDGRVVGSGGLEFCEDSAVLIAGCAHPEARRQGGHSAFVRFRLEEAVRRGLRYATVASVPGGPTERNALRAGFAVAYTQLALRQPTP